MTMRNTHSLYLAGTLASALALGACSSSSDNLDEFEFPNWAGIPTSALSEAHHASASLAVDDLAYQAALIYDVALEGRDFDQVERPFEATSFRHCELGGRLYPDLIQGWTISSNYFEATTIDVSSQFSYGCVEPDPDDAAVTVSTMGQVSTSRFEVACEGGTCPAMFDSFGGSYPYRVRYQSDIDETTTRTDRVEISGNNVGGPDTPVEIDGTERAVQATALFLDMRSATSTQTGEDDPQETIFWISYGTGNGDDRFIWRDVVDQPEFFMDGVLRSASSADESCLGGGIHLETTDALELNADNIVAGSITLTNGETETVGEDEVPLTATLVFEANGDVTVTDPDGMSNTFARGDLETLRQTCTQTVPVKRS